MKLKYKIILVVFLIYLVLGTILCIGIFNWRNKFSKPIEKQMLNSTILNETLGNVKDVKVAVFSFPKSGKNTLEFNVKTEKEKFKVVTEMGMVGYEMAAKKYIVNNKKREKYELYEN